jgi:hypothetical protein
MKAHITYGMVLIASFLIGFVLLRDRPKTRVVDTRNYQIAPDEDSKKPRPPRSVTTSSVDNTYPPDEFNFDDVLSASAEASGLTEEAGKRRGSRLYDEWSTWDVPLTKSENINTWTKYARVCGSTSKDMTCGVVVNCVNVPPTKPLIAETIRRALIHRTPRNHMPPWVAIVLYFTKEGRELALAQIANQSIPAELNIKVASADWISEEDIATIGTNGGATSIYVAQHSLKTFEWILVLNSSFIPSNQVSRLSPPRPAAEAFPMLTYYDVLGRPFPRLEDTFTASSQGMVFATTFLYLRRSKQTMMVLEQWKRNILVTYKEEASRMDELMMQSLTLSLSLNQLPIPVASSLLDVSLCLYDHTGVDWAAHQEISGKRVMPSRFAFCDAYIR